MDKPVVVDLFAGCGGFSKGFLDAGFDVRLAVEIDEWACQTFRYNFPNAHVLCSDVRDVEANHIRELIGQKPDIIIGGPPCQGFSVSVPGGPNKRDPKDPRNSLFMEFVRLLKELKPIAFMIENVPGILTSVTASGERVIKIIECKLSELGYYVKTSLLNACDYGVPQFRERIFIAGVAEKVDNPLFPKPTHKGYKEEYALDRYLGGGYKPYVTLWEAISDLPQIPAGVTQEKYEYPLPPQNDYQALMRKGSDGVYNHIPMKHYKRTIERFKRIKWGQSLSDVPAEFGPRKRGKPYEFSNKRYDQNNRRLHPNRISHTVTASFYANFIHPYLDRNFTAREAARLQSFPDTFIFMGKKTVPSFKLLKREGRYDEMHLCQFAQIGNAVPPLLARALASHLRKSIKSLS